MSRGRRGVLLLGLSLVLGGLAAADVGRREAAVQRRLAPLVPVLVARGDLSAGTELHERHLAVRRVPARYAPVGAAAGPAEVAGGQLAVAVARGGALGAGLLAADPSAGAPVRRGERAVQVLATGDPELLVAGARVDVLVTREGRGTELALQDVEVLAAGPADSPAGPRVAATLRVRLRDAVYLAAADSFARELRLLARAPGDRGRTRALAVGEGLR